MIVFDINSWHYKLILYTFGKNFFLDTSELDWKAIKEIDSTKLIDMTWNNYPRIEKPKTVNLCPYCRAVVASTVLLPLVFLWRLFPHKKRDESRAAMMKRSDRNFKLVRCVVAVGFAAFGVWKIIHEDYGMGIFYIGLAAFNIKSDVIMKKVIMWFSKVIPKRKQKVIKVKEPKKPSKILTTISKKHNAICPPVWFIDKEDMGKLT